MIQAYLTLSAIFLVFGILNLSNTQYLSHNSKSRDVRQITKRQIKRDYKVILLSPVWPVILFMIGKHGYERKYILFPEKFTKKQR